MDRIQTISIASPAPDDTLGATVRRARLGGDGAA